MRAHDSPKERCERERDLLRQLARALAEEARGGVLGDALESLLACVRLETGCAYTVEAAHVALVAERGFASAAGHAPALRATVTAMAERVASSRKAVRIPLVGASDFASALEPELAARGFRALLAHPVKHQREVLGVIVLLAKKADAIDAPAVALVESAAHVLALAIERDRRGEREASYRDELVQNSTLAMLGVLTASVAHELQAKSGTIGARLGEQARLIGDLGESATDWTRPMLAELSELQSELTATSGELGALVGHLSAVGRRHALAERLDVSVLTREGVSAGKSELRRRGVALLEDYAAGCMVTARRDNLVRVVLNLLFCAADACTSVPHERPQIVVRTRLADDRVLVSIDDSGPNIAQEELDALFQPVYAGRERGQRAGLALKICKDVVTADHGTIEVANLDAGGVSFRISLPCAAAVSVPCSPADLPTEPPPNEHVDVRRVFMVDDDELFTRTLKRALRPHDVRSAATASEAEMVLLDPSYSPHVVLCDVGLPGMSGDILHARIASKRPQIARRFIFVTGPASSKEEADYLRDSGCATLQKPFAPDAIWDAVARPLRQGEKPAAPADELDALWQTQPPEPPRHAHYSDRPTLPPDTVEPAL